MGNNMRGIFVLLLISIIFFIWGNNILPLTNPDEVFYVQTTKEMLQHKTWTVPYLFGHPQFEKPIFVYWLLRIAFMLFGISSFGARFFPAIFALLGVITIYLFCLYAYKKKKKAFVCALVFASSALTIGLARIIITDMIFSVFILMALFSFFIGYADRKKKGAGIIFSLIFSALAVLTKGPLGILVPLAVIILFLLIRKELKFLFCSKYTAWGFLLFLLIVIPWYSFIISKFGTAFIHEFFYNDHIRRILEAEHSSNDTWYFYPLYIMVGCMFPWSLYVIASFFYLIKKLKNKGNFVWIYQFLFSWIVAVFIIFQVPHSKLISYIFPLFPALAIITGDFIYNSIILRKRIFYVLSYISCLSFFVFPIIAAKLYRQYAPAGHILYLLLAFYLLTSIAMFILIKKRRLFAYIYLYSLFVPSLLFASILFHNKFDSYVSSRKASSYLLNKYKIDRKILCSKAIVRGVKFYTDKGVAVLDINGSGFFSRHPIVYLNSDEKAKNFLLKQKVTFGIFNKSAWKDIQHISNLYGIRVYLLNKIGDSYIVKIQAKKIKK